MAISDIVNTILSEGQKEIDQIQEDLKKDMAAKEGELKAELKSEKEKLQLKKEQKKSELKRRMDLLGKMEQRDKLLKEKQKLLTKVFDKALENVSQIPDSEYEKLLEALISKLTVESGNIVPAQGKTASTKAVIKKLNKNFTILKEGAFKGGFIIQTDKLEINNCFDELLIAKLKPLIEPKIARILFS